MKIGYGIPPMGSMVLFYGTWKKTTEKNYTLHHNVHAVKLAPPWQPPEGVFKPGWITRDRWGVKWSSERPDWCKMNGLWRGVIREHCGHLAIDWPDITGPEAIWQVK